MIAAIQIETRNAVLAMEQGNAEVQVGVEKTSASGATLREIIKMSEHVGEMISHIATAATEQSAATDQINFTVSEISSTTQVSSSAAAETAKACMDLSSLALDLRNLVGQFKMEAGPKSARLLPRDGHGMVQSLSRGTQKASAARR